MHLHSTQSPLPRVYEEWRPVVGYEGWYEVSSLGRVRRLKAAPATRPGHILKASASTNGYLFVTLFRHNHGRSQNIHRLVAESFLGSPPEGYETNHISGIKTDNRLVNLEWVSHSTNARHRNKLGLWQPRRGVEHEWTRLTEKQVIEIRALKGRLSGREVARRYGICPRHVRNIQNREAWTHLA